MGIFKINPEWKRNKVKSSQIQEVAFDQKSNRLYIVFKNNKVYAYESFSIVEYNKFLNSESAGKYFHRNIKNNLKTTKISNG